MLIRRPPDIAPSEITPRALFDRRREFLRLSAGLALGTLLPSARAGLPAARPSPYSTDEALTPLRHVAGYNNFTEFGFDKDDPARTAQALRLRPWTLTIEGLVRQPKTLDIDDVGTCLPMFDIATAWHETAPARMFLS